MARRAVAGNLRFLLDTREVEKSGPSYSVDTLTALRAELPPATPLVLFMGCLLYTSDAADERSSVDLGGRRIIKKKNTVDKTRA